MDCDRALLWAPFLARLVKLMQIALDKGGKKGYPAPILSRMSEMTETILPTGGHPRGVSLKHVRVIIDPTPLVCKHMPLFSVSASRCSLKEKLGHASVRGCIMYLLTPGCGYSVRR